MDKAERLKSRCWGTLALLAVALGASSPARAQPEPRWISQLPSSADVLRSIRGADAADTTMRQQTAFRVLCKYIEALTGANRFQTERMPPGAVRRLQEYDSAWGKVPGHSGATLEQTYRNEDTYAFQKATLDALVDKASAEAYWNTPAGRKVMAQAQKEAAQATARVEAAASERQAAAELARARATIEPDLAAAKGANIDLSVLGIRLGEPLDLPQCASDNKSFEGQLGLRATGGQSCRSDAQAGMQDQIAHLKEAWTGEGGSAAVRGVTITSVRLAEAKCPDWVKSFGICMASVSLRNSLVVGVSLQVSADKRQKISEQLLKKYGHPNGQGHKVVCKNDLTGLVVDQAAEVLWSLRGVSVSYQPLRADDCNKGLVTVQLASHRRSQGDAETKKAASEPQL